MGSSGFRLDGFWVVGMASICLKVWERVLSCCSGLGYVRSFGALSRVRVSGVGSV